ncbi:MAG: ferrous iron transport protein B [Pirellulales bacterium]|nr:ferrous iron transport protein B [Pirellulales bacterium]
MQSATTSTAVTIALVGNPNTGKSTLFNALAGMRQRVGNYPGVTVEKKVGKLRIGDQAIDLVDLPGTYSLAPRSPDEMVAVDVLLGRRAGEMRPDAVISIVDAGNLERNLYLVSQVLELGLPTIVVLNMADVARRRGVTIDLERLERQLGVPIVVTEANHGVGIEELKRSLTTLLGQPPRSAESPFPEPFCREVAALDEQLAARGGGHERLPRYLVERLLLDTAGYLEETLLDGDRASLRQELSAARARLAATGAPVPAVEAIARYGWVGRVLEGVVTRPVQQPVTASDRIDRVLTHKVWGTLIFVVIMAIVFQSVFRWAGPAMDLIDGGFGALGEWAGTILPEGVLQSLVVDGIIAGVGGVLVFLPQIFILFLFLAILEDCGYMARAAYLMDRLFVRIGLSGKSFIPLLSSFACAIPGVMATRVIENRRDRLTTMLIAPLMSCSARLPVYTVLIGAFIPERAYFGGLLKLQGLTMFAMYVLGIVVAAGVALVLKRSLLRGATPPFVMELPAYKWPAPYTVLHRMFDRGWAFVRRAGTLIVAVSIVVWAALYFPHPTEEIEGPFTARRAAIEAQLSALPTEATERESLEEKLAAIDGEIAGAYQRQSFLGRAGHWIEPLVRPLGWDWRIGAATIASFPAREVVVATLGIIYNLGGEVDIEADEDRTRLESALRGAKWDGTDRPVYNTPVALSIMVFFALCAQCAATLVVIRRETNSWRWPIFTFVYMTALAYVAALVTYQVGMLFVA